jgi:dipeptidyl aminopeptidase/acylaminoacyl peptidase
MSGVRAHALALLTWTIGASALAQPAGRLDMEAILAIRHPSGASWSPDGNRVAFVWDRGGVQNLYLVDRVGGWPEALTSFSEGLLSPPFWSPDGVRLFFERGGELWSLAIAEKGSAPRAVFGTETSETGVRLSPDGSQVAFLRLDDVWVRNLESGREKRLTVTPSTEYAIVWSPDGRTVAFQFARTTPREDDYEAVGAKIAFRRATEEPSEIAFVPAAGGAVTQVAGGSGFKTSPAWVDARRLTFQRVSEDYRTREVLIADVATGEVRSLHRDVDARWWSLEYLGAEPKPSPDGRWIAFVSDRSGWDSLYLVSPDGGPLHRVTPDDEEARRFAWSPDGARIAFDTNRGHPGRRHLAVADVSDPGRPEVRMLTEARGTNVQLPDSSGFTLANGRGGWSPDGQRILYQHTDSKRPPDLLWIDASGRETAPHELTYSLPSGVDRSLLVEPELVHYPSTDGQQVPAYLFVPPDLDRSRKHPAVVWIHGDGIAQNYDGWHVRRDYGVYYSFHQYLAQQGYIVLAPDYRGSIGYGRSWRVAPYRDLGGMDAEDIASAVPYLESLLYVDTGRIGVWGLSYGGFLTLAALTRDPGLFRCGVDVAGVHDFRLWYRDPGGSWVESRLGDPRENADAYLQAAPVARIDRLERPLLVLHGTADVNVPFLESVLLVDALLKKGKQVDFAMYPGEFHYFHREHVLRDAWTRVASFFDRNLREK